MLEFLQESKLYIGFSFEILAAVAGFLYLKKSSNIPPEIKIFIYYLFYIVLIEFYAFFPIWAWVNNYEQLGFYEDSPFRTNHWYGNVNVLIYAICFSQLYIRDLRNKKIKNALVVSLWVLVILGVVRYITSGNFFEGNHLYIRILETFFVVICVGFYYLELLRSNNILYFHRNVKFYISIGVILWSLCVFPLEIYAAFFNYNNPYFMKIDFQVMKYANIFLYSIYAVGFFIDYRFRRKLVSPVLSQQN